MVIPAPPFSSRMGERSRSTIRVPRSGLSETATIVVTPATPTVTWADPAGIVSGTPLSSARLDATANVPGTFTDTPAAGSVLGVGNNQALSVAFAPTDSKGASATATLDVLAVTTASATYL